MTRKIRSMFAGFVCMTLSMLFFVEAANAT